MSVGPLVKFRCIYVLTIPSPENRGWALPGQPYATEKGAENVSLETHLGLRSPDRAAGHPIPRGSTFPGPPGPAPCMDGAPGVIPGGTTPSVTFAASTSWHILGTLLPSAPHANLVRWHYCYPHPQRRKLKHGRVSDRGHPDLTPLAGLKSPSTAATETEPRTPATSEGGGGLHIPHQGPEWLSKLLVTTPGPLLGSLRSHNSSPPQ